MSRIVLERRKSFDSLETIFDPADTNIGSKAEAVDSLLTVGTKNSDSP